MGLVFRSKSSRKLFKSKTYLKDHSPEIDSWIDFFMLVVQENFILSLVKQFAKCMLQVRIQCLTLCWIIMLVPRWHCCTPLRCRVKKNQVCHVPDHCLKSWYNHLCYWCVKPIMQMKYCRSGWLPWWLSTNLRSSGITRGYLIRKCENYRFTTRN